MLNTHAANTSMAQQTEGMHYSLPLSRLFPNHPNAKILDCFLSNYKIDQSIEHVMRFTGLKKDEVVSGIEQLVKEKLIEPYGDNYVTDFRPSSARLIGLYSYYRATMGANLDTMFPSEST